MGKSKAAREAEWDRLFDGQPTVAPWLHGLTHKDWYFDGYPIRGEAMLARFNGLDWSKAWIDMGPSVAGNIGPYWHVPLPAEETVHRLYPKLLGTKWLWLVREAITRAPKVHQRIDPPSELSP